MSENFQSEPPPWIPLQNLRGIADFEGYSPLEMEFILWDSFGTDSPIRLLPLSERDYQKIPLLNQIRYLAERIEQAGEIKLTARGFLPTRLVADIYRQGYLKDEHIESGISHLNKETDCMTIQLTRILLLLSGIAKTRNKRLSLTRAGRKMLPDLPLLLDRVLQTFCRKFNWGYFDRYDADDIGSLGVGFSLILLSKYGQDRRPGRFYADKYFRAYPRLLAPIGPTPYQTPESYAASCYTLRTFERFLAYFGLVRIKRGARWNSDIHVSTTPLFDQLISCAPPADWSAPGLS